MPFSEPGPIRESSNLKAIDYSTWGQCHLKQVICQKCCDLYFTKKSEMLNSGIRALLSFPVMVITGSDLCPHSHLLSIYGMAVWSVRPLRLWDTASFFYGKRTDHRWNWAPLMYLPGYKSFGKEACIFIFLFPLLTPNSVLCTFGKKLEKSYRKI